MKTGIFYHIVATYDGNTMSLYLNGELVGNRSVSSSTLSGGKRIQLSAPGQGVDNFDGLLDDIGTYGRALTPEEVMFLFLRN